MDYRGMSQRELAKEAGISQSAVGFLLRYSDMNDRHPTTSTVEAIAKAFSIRAWQLMIPDAPLELLLSQQLEKHTMDYMQVGPEGREAVDRITEVEVRSATLQKGLNTGDGSVRKAG